ncbi:glycosyltransferase [Psychrobacter sp. UBA3962]|uniref:glycosyltransferase n=1 Tax=Psychrobacter sp. UBA3962 TaxID=1947352 RepID=UPI0025D2BDF5|nr:glycosyltransferase [Psychrobacter sp. UBA3962]
MTKLDNSHPLVTVYMPTYNRVELLQRAVQSVLCQDYKNIELIVVDDGSTDGTHEYLARIAEQHSCFKYFINKKNSGACISRNKAIFAANGEFITGLDDDDYFLPNRISNFLSFWKNIDKDCIALYSNTYVKGKNNTLKPDTRVTSCSKADLLLANCVGNQIFTKTEFLQNIEGFDKELAAWQDMECWYRLLKFYNAKAYSTQAYTYVVDMSHPHERISTSKIDSILKAYKHICNKYELSPRKREILSIQLAPYTKIHPKISSIALSLLYSPKKHTLKRAILMTYKSLTRKPL